MAVLSIGDLAMSFYTRGANARLKADMQRLNTELTLGVTQDLRGVTGGDLGALAGLEHALGTLGSYRVAANEASLFVATTQRVLETVQQTSSDIGPALLQAAGSGQTTLVETAATDARARFATIVSALNTRVADRSVLGGTATGNAPLADAETMLAQLKIATAAQSTAAGVEAVVEAWFDTPGGGFETDGYLGSKSDLAPFRIGPHESAGPTLRADNPDLRELLKGFAMAALVSAGVPASDHNQRVELLRTSASRILTSDKSIAEIQAGVGVIEARIDTALARNGAEGSALEIARSEILAIDPYRAATDLEAVQTRLQTLYTITARLSRLNLAEYLR